MMTTKVQLRAAKIPKIGFLAVHYYYVIIKENQADRWEIWQKAALIPSSWGHLHKNLLSVNSGVGNGGSWLEKSWTGEMAQKLSQILENSPYSYPYNYFYLYFPGPNSNTYAQWVLKQSDCNHTLSFRGIGKYY